MILSNVKFYFGAYDLTGDTNLIDLSDKPDLKDDTRFGHDALSRRKGLDNIVLNAQGFLNLGAGGLEEALLSDFDALDIAVTIGFLTGAGGEVAHFFLGAHSAFKSGGKIGDMLPYAISIESRGHPLCRGNFLVNEQKTQSGNGTAYQLGAVLGGPGSQYQEKLYAVLHVLNIQGAAPTLDVIIESDDAEGFPSPTTRITFSQKSAKGYEWATPVEGPITDDWWRASWTLGAQTTSATFLVVMAKVKQL